MNKANMILDLCSKLDIEYTDSMHRVNYEHLKIFHNKICTLFNEKNEVIDDIIKILDKHYIGGNYSINGKLQSV